MSRQVTVKNEDFALLLDWLGADHEAARLKYEHVRRTLVRVLAGRGCYEAEELTDETILRVARKVSEVADGYTGDPTAYFVSVANNVYREWLRRPKPVDDFEFERLEAGDRADAGEGDRLDCLDSCLEKLPAGQSGLILDYYREEKRMKIEHRRLMAERLGIKPNTLQIRLFRIRAGLRACVEDCLSRKAE